MNEHTSLQKYISDSLFSRGLMFLWCVRDEWRQGQTAILTQVPLLTIAAFLLHLGLGCSTEGHSPQSASWFSLWHSYLQLNSTAAGTCLYSFITPTCFHLFTQVHFLIDSSVKGQYITFQER